MPDDPTPEMEPWTRDQTILFYTSKLRTVQKELADSREAFHAALYKVNLDLAAARRRLTRAGNDPTKVGELPGTIAVLKAQADDMKVRYRQRVRPLRREINSVRRLMKRHGL